jgi:SAM-dependent methyltransferase
MLDPVRGKSMTLQVRERALQVLRGKHNSVRHRFYGLPKRHISYLLHLMHGGGWTEYYREMVNQSAVQQTLSDGQYEKLIRNIMPVYEFLLGRGLASGHTFLDYGCGRMRLGALVIPYLTTGRYTGAELSPDALEKGVGHLAKKGILPGSYDTVVISDCNLRELQGRSFDFIMANSVFTHTPENEISQMLVSMRPLIKKGRQFFFTFMAADESARANFKDYYYPVETMERLVTKAGYKFSIAKDYKAMAVFDRMGVAEPV